jgi:hypothetical protein
MRKHWIVSAAAAIAAAVGGISYASLADSVILTGSTATAGTLSVDLKSGGTTDAEWGTFGPLAPQIDGNPAPVVKRVRVTNTGTVPGTLHFQAIGLVSSEVGPSPSAEACVPPERTAEQGDCGSVGELSQQLQVEVVKMTRASNDDWTRDMSLGFMSLQTLADSEHGTGTLVLDKNDTVWLQFEFALPGTPKLDPSRKPVTEPVSNTVQGDTATFKMRFSLRSV